MKRPALLWDMGFWPWLDSLGHWLHLPKFIQSRLCDRADVSLGWNELPEGDDEGV